MKKSPCLFLILTGFALAFSNCHDRAQWEQDCTDLLQQSAGLEHRHHQLEARIDSLWDAVSIQLDRDLPAGLPPMDREIFVKSRNADHIRMFMSFKQLNPELQSLVNEAGQYDSVLARQVQDLLKQRDAFEAQKIQFLQQVEKKDPAAGRAFADRFGQASDRRVKGY